MNMFFPDTPARLRIIRIIRSYGLALRHPAAPARHRSLPGRATCPASEPAACQARAKVGIFPRKKIPVLLSKEDLQLFLPMAARPQLPGIARPRPASEPAPRSGFFLPRSGFRLRSTPRSVFRLRFSFRFCPKKHSVSDAVLAVSLTECFFTTHTPCRQSWRGHRIATLNPGVGTGLPHSILAWAQDCSTQSCCGDRIATLNPGVGTGLPHSILAWAQDCHTQSWRGHRIAPPNPAVATGLLHPILLWQQDCSTQSCCGNRIAPPNPAVATGLPRCFPENAGSAVLYSTTPPDSPPGLRGKHRQCVGVYRRTPGLAARIARKTTEAHCCIAGHSRKKPAAMP